MKNEWAHLDDDLSTTAGAEGLAALVNFIAFIVFWVLGGSFWMALILTLVFYSLVGGAAYVIARTAAAVFARRDVD